MRTTVLLRSLRIISFFFIVGRLFPSAAYGEASFDVHELIAQGRMYEALVRLHEGSDRSLTTTLRLARARSQWALGLVHEARNNFRLLQQEVSLSHEEKIEVLLAPFIILLQEEKFAEAISEGIAVLDTRQFASDPSVRARLLYLLGDGYYHLGRVSEARNSLTESLELSSERQKNDTYYLLGVLEESQDKMDDACKFYLSLPVHHGGSGHALTSITRCAVNNKKEEEALRWLQKGEKDYPELFLPSWTALQRLELAVQGRNEEVVKGILDQSYRVMSGSDPWVVLLQARGEAFLAQQKKEVM
jgi:tetratricopeptide (TPR) repeat protein